MLSIFLIKVNWERSFCLFNQLFLPRDPPNVLRPMQRTQHCWPTTSNIVGPDNVVTCCVRLHGSTTMLVLVGTCCVEFETGQTFRRMQTDATLLANNTQQCWELLALTCCVRLHGPFGLYLEQLRQKCFVLRPPSLEHQFLRSLELR